MKTAGVILDPSGLPALRLRNLDATACVVFDILRATSTFVTALHHGADRVIPVSEIADALAWRQREPGVLLAGERGGVKIGASLAGGTAFELGNSPREFTPDTVRGRTIVSTTTNGTRALNACQHARVVLAGSFLNLSALTRFLLDQPIAEILVICAGTGNNRADEDVLAAGALGSRLASHEFVLTDELDRACQQFKASEPGLARALGQTENGRRLMSIPELRDDVAFCAQTDLFDLAAVQKDGALTALRA